MKRCPKCSRTFPDENQKFCTFDGGLLMVDQPLPPPLDPNMTMRATSKNLTRPESTSEAETSVQLPDLNKTIAAFGSTTFRETTAEPTAEPTSRDLVPPPAAATSEPTPRDLVPPPQAATSEPTPRDLAATQFAPAVTERSLQYQTAPPLVQPVAPPKKRSVLPWIVAVLVLLLLLGGGGVAAGYFFWLKPLMDANNNRQPRNVRVTKPPEENSNASTNSNAATENANTRTNTNIAVNEKPAPFNPPLGATRFTNSKANLDGKLAEHYVDFNFYYLKSWTKDPKSGVHGASNFVGLDRKSDKSSDYPAENVAISWYTSNGTFASDQSIFSDRARELSNQLSRTLPNYEQVSAGETKVNSLPAYQFLFQGVIKNAGKSDLPYWGRVIFLPPGSADQKNGVTIIMLATSLASGIQGPSDVGVQGELPLILDSFRFGAS
jgi:hypothetical protein